MIGNSQKCIKTGNKYLNVLEPVEGFVAAPAGPFQFDAVNPQGTREVNGHLQIRIPLLNCALVHNRKTKIALIFSRLFPYPREKCAREPNTTYNVASALAQW